MLNLINMHKLSFFAIGDSICANDFKERDRGLLVNFSCVESVTEPVAFILPISEHSISNKYSVVTMFSGATYYIRESEYDKLYVAWYLAK
jgi:hypothetical protein